MADSEKGKRKRKIGLNQKELKTFAHSILEHLTSQKAKKGIEPFEAYAQDLKTRLFTHEPSFPERFVKGYEVIMTTLSNTSSR